MTAVTATTASPPGRFSITTGWPHRLLNRSPSRRVPKSTPLPGPRVTTNLTGRCGQFCAVAGNARAASKTRGRPVRQIPSANAVNMTTSISPLSHTISTIGIKRIRSTGNNQHMSDREQAGSWIGASLLRKEDARYLHGRGMFIADVDMPGVQDIAFVRSQMANANIRQMIKPTESARRVFTLAEIGPINVLEAGPELAAHRHSPYPPLADRRVRYVGQTIAACMMPTRAQAEDLADKVHVELEELPAEIGRAHV